MRRYAWVAAGLLLIVGTASAGFGQEATVTRARELSQAFAQVAQRVMPSVVNISTSAVIPGRRVILPPFFDLPPELDALLTEPPQEVHSLGSGVIIRPDGYIVTNYHVVAKAQRIVVGFLDGQSAPAEIAGLDAATELAVIKVGRTGLSPAEWGDSDRLQVGEWVLAIGSPMGLRHSVTAGIVSAKGRSGVGISSYEDFIQTDAAINPGNSGGALVNMDAQVVGINTAIFSRTGGYEGIGFAIPSNTAARIASLLISQGEVVRGYLGILPATVTPQLARRLGLQSVDGVLVRNIYRDSPAHRAGLAAGDVIVAFNGQAIQSITQLARAVAEAKIGSQATVTVVRQGQKLTLRVPVEKRPAELGGEIWFGI
ncbi:MAG: trypsin-like peptidase domain-containing protein [Armatimonadetes bacterium]|nr:trypsin-like peptidase domain-containing protein [Armatimonadota bacterium]